MTILWTLLQKDLLRILRSPGAYIIMLALPLVMAALLGATVGGGNGDQPRVRVAVVDQDASALSQAVIAAFDQDPFQVRVLDETQAHKAIAVDGLSAVVHLPADFGQNFAAGRVAPLSLMKNPTQPLQPHLVEERLHTLGDILNLSARHGLKDTGVLGDILTAPDTRVAFQEYLSRHKYASMDMEAGVPSPSINLNLSANAEQQTIPPIATYLPALAALFLLFLGDRAVRDLFREMELKTLDRFRALRFHLMPMILSKASLVVVVVAAGGGLLLGGGSLFLDLGWSHALPMTGLILAYAAFGAGLLTTISALVGNQKAANTLTTMLLMVMGFLGGSMLPADQLPAFVRDHVTAYSPTYWFSNGVMTLQYGMDGAAWWLSASLLAGIGLILVILSVGIWNRRLSRGIV